MVQITFYSQICAQLLDLTLYAFTVQSWSSTVSCIQHYMRFEQHVRFRKFHFCNPELILEKEVRNTWNPPTCLFDRKRISVASSELNVTIVIKRWYHFWKARVKQVCIRQKRYLTWKLEACYLRVWYLRITTRGQMKLRCLWRAVARRMHRFCCNLRYLQSTKTYFQYDGND